MKIFIQLLFLALFLSACISSERKEGATQDKLIIYAAFEHEQVDEYMRAFKDLYPQVETELMIDSHGVVMAKLLAERQNPRADVVFGLSVFNVLQLKELELLAPLQLGNVGEFKDGFRDKDTPPYYVGLSGVESVIIVNEKELQKRDLPIPSSYKDLTNPVYKGLITMPNPTSSGTGFLSVAGWMELYGEEGAWEFMRNLDSNIAFYTHSGSKPARMAASGEYPVGISLGYRGHKMLKDGQSIRMIFPSEGYGWDLESLALIKKNEIKQSAKDFIDFAASKDAMSLYANNNALTAITTDKEPPLGYLKEQKNLSVDFERFAKERDAILKKWDELFKNKTEAK